MPGDLRPCRLRAADVARLATAGARTRPLRAVLAALGIAVGVAAMVAIVGISTSSRAAVDDRIAELGPNLLQIEPGTDALGVRHPLPTTARASLARIGPVLATSSYAALPVAAYRNDQVETGLTGSLSVAAVDPSLLGTLHARIGYGHWFDRVSERFPAVVLGAAAAQRLGVSAPGTRLWVGAQWCAVIGILDAVPVAPDVDTSVLLAWSTARSYFHFTGHPGTVYVRVVQDELEAVAALAARSVAPATPQFVLVRRPTDALVARFATTPLSGLLVGLGAVGLLIGGIGVANTMVVSVLERRSEIGLRRALGATRGQIRGQFVSEAAVLALSGGAVGTLIGTLATAFYASERGWPVAVPGWASGGALGLTLAVGVIAGWYPAMRAGRLSPTQALAAA
jgi:putative ABC transport system permease protein